MSYKISPLSVKGAKYNQRIGDDYRERLPERAPNASMNMNGHYNNFFLAQQSAAAVQRSLASANTNTMHQTSTHSSQPVIQPHSTPTSTTTSSTPPVTQNKTLTTEKYWKMDENSSSGDGDVVVIHVCDENQQISKDFCCKRDILVKHMKYFEKFLAENENGYDDIDISVHCDVEIFEWLMTYIHEPDTPPKIEKSIIVSILISSEFLQMDALVDVCIQQVAGSLSEIIKLPIDLSCISEKLVNRIAFLTQPKALSETKDRKDKILTKLYKRRVELDFSRKGSTAPRSTASSSSVPTSSNRTIAAALTCCRHCGLVYLDNYVSLLTCRTSPPSVDFRGQLASRHSAIVGWSLTSYLKTLHSGGMGWDAIYWHVWAACVVFRAEDTMISALEVDRYTVEPDGLCIRGSAPKEDGEALNGSAAAAGSNTATSCTLPPRALPAFSLSVEDSCNQAEDKTFMLKVSTRPDLVPANPATTSSLNPARPPEVLTPEIFDLICTQMKYIVGLSHKLLIQKTMKSTVDTSKVALPPRAVDFGELLWRNPPRCSTYRGSIVYVDVPSSLSAVALNERRRGRSPGRGARLASAETRKHSQSLPKSGGRTTLAGGIASSSPKSMQSSPVAATMDSSTAAVDSEVDPVGKPPAGGNERRSRSSSTGARPTSGIGHGLGGSVKNLKRMSIAATPSPEDSSVSEEGASPTVYFNGTVVDQQTAKHVAVLQSLPPEVQVRILQTKGPVYGQWMVHQPLQVRAAAHSDSIRSVQESALTAPKKLEWELDIMREWDEKRMDVFERFLVSRRNRVAEPPVENRRPLRRNIRPAIEYYKDKGRQASNR